MRVIGLSFVNMKSILSKRMEQRGMHKEFPITLYSNKKQVKKKTKEKGLLNAIVLLRTD